MSRKETTSSRKIKTKVEFQAENRVTVINGSGLVTLEKSKASQSGIGLKGLGLSALPSIWTPRFMILSADGIEAHGNDKKLFKWISKYFGGDSKKKLIVRSSGTNENIANRGQLSSRVCELKNVCNSIEHLVDQVNDEFGVVHWVIQEYVPHEYKGHLSNERHLRKEPRDWIAEFEVDEGIQPLPVPISIRTWREGSMIHEDLTCVTSFGVSLVLKNVAKWGWRYAPQRLHFEWLWDGERVWVVQADVVAHNKGVDPHSLVPKQIAEVSISDLRVFRIANSFDYDSFGKLRNAKLYSSLGYSMPTFYLAPSEKFLAQLLRGKISSDFKRDLEILTKRPLIVRTDGKNIPKEKHEMLPRSDELRSAEEAIGWLKRDLIPKINENGLDQCEIVLIAHHFIPSISSAWARAEPNERVVRIESLWGIPEGLYYFTHDTFEVDTTHRELSKLTLAREDEYVLRQRLRYKGSLIGPDVNGDWVIQQAAPPYDWIRSIKWNRWIFEIATTTRRIAEEAGYPVAVMWFIDNHPAATSHKVLPWFHSKSEIGSAKAVMRRRKFAKQRDFEVRTSEDFELLKRALERKESIVRVSLNPTDPEYIRNPKFAKELGKIAFEHKIVIELSGGILSHAFYLLQKYGATVECVDLYGADDEVIEFNKVVRDKIPELIKKGGEQVETVRIEGDALVFALQSKLVEEAFEAMDARSGEELVGELADAEEVIQSICKLLEIPSAELEELRIAKNRKRGSFEKGLMLRRTTLPHSVHTGETTKPDELAEIQTIDDVSELPANLIYRRPDLITVDQLPEKRLSFEIGVSELGKPLQPLNFSIPIDGVEREFRLIIDLERKSSKLRGLIRLRLEPQQLILDFPSQ